MIAVIPYLLVLSMPLGVAVQNICAWLSLLMGATVLLIRHVGRAEAPLTPSASASGGGEVGRQAEPQVAVDRKWLLRMAVAAVVMVLLPLAASWLNPGSPATVGDGVGHVLGYLPWAALPLMILRLAEGSDADTGDRVIQGFRRAWSFFLIFVLPLWALVALSQSWWGWALIGDGKAGGLFRPRGFYSHPLSLAYASLLIWPWVLDWLGRMFDVHTRGRKSLMLALIAVAATATILVLTASRTVQGVALAILGYYWLRACKRRQRDLIVAYAICGCAFLAFVFGAGSQKWQETFSEAGHDVQSQYSDDRLAFWAAHRVMINERPWFGHGIELGREYRRPYYEAIGLGGFSKQYEAHNLYLQQLANGGFLMLAAFCAWFFCLWRAPFAQGATHVMLAGLSVASLTQNSLYDYEVRQVLTVLVCVGLAKVLFNARIFRDNVRA